MSDQSCFALLCGTCCIAIFSAFDPWYRFGGNCCCACGGPRGCCYSCFDEEFNKDTWVEEGAQQEQEGNADQGDQTVTQDTKGDEIVEQPTPVPMMDSESTKPSAPVGTAS